MKKIFLALIFCLIFAGVSYAEDPIAANAANELKELIGRFNATEIPSRIDEPIDISVLIDSNARTAVMENFKKVVENLDPQYVQDIQLPPGSTGFIAQASANWMISRALLFGFTGLSDAKNTVDSWATFDEKGRVSGIKEGSPAWFIARTSQIARSQIETRNHGNNTPVDLGGFVETESGETNVPSEALNQIKKLKDISQYAASLENVPGIQAGDSVYDRSLLIAQLLWCAIFVINIVWIVYKMLIAGEPADLLTTFFRNIFIFISLLLLRPMITIGMTVSTAVGNAILGGADVAQAVSDISEIVDMKQSLVSTSGVITGMIADAFVTISGAIARAVVYVMFILSDVMVAIASVIGPWMLVLSLLPFCESWISHWIKSYITFLFYRPLACLLCVVLYIVGLTGMDMGLVELMITCIVFVMAAVKVPSMAENMGGAAAAVGAGMAGMVSRSLKTGASIGARAAGIGAVATGAKLLSSLKDKATPPREG
jgi:hypothetical protein